MRSRGLRITRQRQAILEHLLSTNEHLSARRIWETVRKRVPGTSLSTVYSALGDLTKHNIIKALEFNETENRYEGNMSQHINLVCLKCGKISDYMTPHTIDMEQIRQATRFRALQSRFELYGVCAACGKR